MRESVVRVLTLQDRMRSSSGFGLICRLKRFESRQFSNF